MKNHDFLTSARLDGSAYIVLGAGGGGIGAATAKALSASGADVFCVDVDEEEANEIASQVGGTGHRADITNRAEVERLFSRAQTLYGANLRGVVSIVGYSTSGPLEGFDDEAIDRQFRLIFHHALLAIQIGAPLLAENGGGTIALVGSMAGETSTRHQSLYGIAKAAVHHLTRTAGVEYASAGVRVNAVAPSFIRTPRMERVFSSDIWTEIEQANPLKRAATTEDVAKAILFLSSSLSEYITGQILHLDGGAGNVLDIPGLEVPQNSATEAASRIESLRANS